MQNLDTNLIEEYIQSPSENYIHRLSDRWKGYLYFTEEGKARLANNMGYILGMYRGGQEEFAISLANSLFSCLDRLAGSAVDPKKSTITLSTGETFQVPTTKCVVGDDGTWGGFSLAWYTFIHPEDMLKAVRKKLGLDDTVFIHINNPKYTDILKELNVLERVNPNYVYSEEINSYIYSKEMKETLPIHYKYIYNGGLLYHGPGGVEVFSVTLENGCLWSVHT